MRFGEIGQSASNVINFDNLERDPQMSLRNLHKLGCGEKPAPLFRIPL
jgi:hypothetical protein